MAPGCDLHALRLIITQALGGRAFDVDFAKWLQPCDLALEYLWFSYQKYIRQFPAGLNSSSYPLAYINLAHLGLRNYHYY